MTSVEVSMEGRETLKYNVVAVRAKVWFMFKGKRAGYGETEAAIFITFLGRCKAEITVPVGHRKI